MHKGLPTVLQALAGLPDDVLLLVVGANAASRDCVARAPNPCAAGVHLVAETSQVEPYCRAADLYVHPTLNDSFGMAPLEAMSFGLPVILSPAPWCGFAQYVRPDAEALVLEPSDGRCELALAIGRLRADSALRERLQGRRAGRAGPPCLARSRPPLSGPVRGNPAGTRRRRVLSTGFHPRGHGLTAPRRPQAQPRTQ